MKKVIVMSLLLAYQVLLANSPYAFVEKKYTEKKEIHKNFKINEKTSLFVSNQYGTITIVTNENQTDALSIDVKIKVSGNHKDDVQKRLEQISIDFSQTSNHVTATTNIKKNTYFFNFFTNPKSVNMQIDYVISLPINNKMKLKNQYGDILINKTLADLEIEIDYGSVHINQAHKASIQMDYSHNSFIKEIHQLSLWADYSKIHIEQANRINSWCDYSDLKINKVNKITTHNDYGKIHIQSIHEGDIWADYCPISIDAITPQTTQVKINGEYSPISVRYDPTWDFSYSFSAQYASIEKPQSLTPKLSRKTQNQIFEQGVRGSGKNRLEINSQYGKIKIEELGSEK